jgi:hypothetical protein
MPASNSAIKAGHSAKSQKPAELLRNHLPACSGLGCRLAPEWGADLERIFHHRVFVIKFEKEHHRSLKVLMVIFDMIYMI